MLENKPSDLGGLDRGLTTGVIIFRWAAWVWMAVVALLEREHLERPGVAALLTLAALGITIAATFSWRQDPDAGPQRSLVVAELLAGSALLVAAPLVQDGNQSQTLGSAWPLVGPLVAGLAFGPRVGLGAGVTLGIARGAAAIVGAPRAGVVSIVSSAVLYGAAGAICGSVARRLREGAAAADYVAKAQAQLALASERENIARNLHDGVLQTLAVIQRRSEDPELTDLARRQERELREYLSGPAPPTDLMSEMRKIASRFIETTTMAVQVISPEPVKQLGSPTVEAIRGAVTEALNNAFKHGGARHVTVFIEPVDSGVFVSVKDDGAGFQTSLTEEGVGLSRSIRARINEVGGRVELSSRPGDGTEVRIWA